VKRIIIILLLLAGYVDTLYGQSEDVIDSALVNITKQLLAFPQEKIYLHTDKPYYITGEKIFFRAFLLDAYSNKQIAFSRYIYVELINPADSVVQRLRIRPDENTLYYGAIPLSEELPQGIYKMRAYTKYMYNQGESSFFSKSVRISDPQILSTQIETDFQFTDDGKINASLHFVDSETQEVIRPQSVTLRLNRGQSFTAKPDKDGWIRVKLTVPPKAATRVLYIELNNNRNIFRQYLQIPYPDGDFCVYFYPEGGYLIPNQPSNVAFKAINSTGTALNIKGEIVDSKGNTVTEIKTVYDGMGDCFFIPQPDEHYHAVCHNGDRTLRFDLPEVQKNAIALKTTIRDNRVFIAINKTGTESYSELYLFIHSRGSIVYAKAWDPAKDFITFDASFFPSGINHILLLSKDFRIVSERLIFLLNDDEGTVDFNQEGTYSKREEIQAGVQLKDGEQEPLKGNFSIAVTNDREVAVDTTLSILSGILLQSELRGNIENPEYYFQKGNKASASAADLLMKTHGWTRYALGDVFRGEISYPKIPFEMGQEITGTVKTGILSKLAKNSKLSLISLNQGFFDITETDENGRYVFQHFEYPDSTKYVIQALNSKGKGKQTTELYVDEDTFPGINTAWNAPFIHEESSNPEFMDYVAKADLYYTYENGKRIVHLPEVEVKSANKSFSKYKSAYYIDPDYSISEEKITKYGATNIKDLLYLVPGVMVAGDRISIRGSFVDPLVVIDDMPFTPSQGQTAIDILNMLNINDIGQIDFIKDGAKLAMYGSRGSGGAIVLYTKRGEARAPLLSFNIKQLIPLGYQLPVEFYSPKYDTQESINNSKPDLRTTIYWNPNVMTDENGKAALDFYTADDPSTYSVIIEGVSDDGRLIHYYGSALITVK